MTRKLHQYLPLFVLGICSFSIQIIILRKFLDVFQGTELILGIVLSNWMLTTGFGVWLAKKHIKNSVQNRAIANLILAVLPIFTLFALTAASTFLLSGILYSFALLFLVVFLILLPYNLAAGCLYPWLTEEIAKDSDFTVSHSLLAFTLGAVTGILILNVILTSLLPYLAVVYVLFLVSLYQVWLILKPIKKRNTVIYLLGVLLFFTLFYVFINPGEKLKIIQFQKEKILLVQLGKEGNLDGTESKGVKKIYNKGLLFTSEDDSVRNKESVHYSLLQSVSPKKVLLISGGIPDQINEILKYPVERLDFSVLSPGLLKPEAKRQQLLTDNRVHWIESDPRIFLKTSKEQYDVVIIQLPQPQTIELNRYFTHEFFRGILRNLAKNAILNITLKHSSIEEDSNSKEIYTILYNSLTYSFKHVMVIEGTGDYFLASDAGLSIKIDSLTQRRLSFSPFKDTTFLSHYLTTSNIKEIKFKTEEKATLNRDFQPIVYFKLFEATFPTNNIFGWFLCLIFCGLVVLYLLKIKKQRISMFVSGLTATSLLFLLFMAFQAILGTLYTHLAGIVLFFTLGISASNTLYPWLWKKGYAPSPAWNMVYSGGFVLVFLMTLLGYKNIAHTPDVLQIIFLIISLLIGFFTGLQFAAVATEQEDSPGIVAADIYSTALFGSAFGMIAVSSFLFPIAGIIWICLGLGVLNFVLGFIMFE